jgi:putative peptide zinc metalloprotease protein
MRLETTSLRLPGVLAKGLRRPKFRSDLKISEQVVAGETSYMVMFPEGFARLSAFEYRMLQLCDGTRTPAELAAAANALEPESPVTEQEVADWIETVHSGFWERSLGEKNLAILQKIRDERKQRVDRSNIFYIKFSAWNPNRVLNAIHPWLKWMYTRQFFYFCLLFFAATAVVVFADYERIHHDTLEFYNFTNKGWYDIWIFWFLLFVVSAVHEFGHGLTCKHYGGDVPQMGLLLMYFTPAFYTDVSEMYMFDKPIKRLWTIFAGVWIELVLCGVATWIWYFLPPGSFFGDLCYKTLLMTGVSGVLFNMNPLMKWDGYYALSQYLEIENLYENAFDYLKHWLQRYLYATLALLSVVFVMSEYLHSQYGFGKLSYLFGAAVAAVLAQTPVVNLFPVREQVELPAVTRRRARIYFFYAVFALTYILLVLVIVAGFAFNVLTSKFGLWGYPLTGVLLYFLLRKRLANVFSALWASLPKAKERLMAWQLSRKQQMGGAALAAILLLPLPSGISPASVTSEFILEPGARADVCAFVPGLIAEVRVREGDEVGLGQVLAVLHNPEVTARARMAERQLALAERNLLAARVRGDLGALQQFSQERRRLATVVEEARRQDDSLVMRATRPGVVTTPQIELRAGEYLAAGDCFATLADRQVMKARILVRDWELEDVAEGARAKLNLRAHPFESFSGVVRQIMPAAADDRPVTEPEKLERKGQEITNFFAVVLEFENPEGRLKEGMTGTAKIYSTKRVLGLGYPLLYRGGRAVVRWARSNVW